jgi:hypothetical protein
LSARNSWRRDSVWDELFPDDHILLPWHAQGHPRTGLNRKSAAVCSWVTMISTSDVINISGIVPSQFLLQIIAKRKALGP